MYHLLTGRIPSRGENVFNRLAFGETRVPASIKASDPQFSDALAHIVARKMEN